jgi:tetratricopeptide (TPR) repeat protein
MRKLISATLSLSIAAAVLAGSTFAQQPSQSDNSTKAVGIRLYEQGNSWGAIEALLTVLEKTKDDSESWYYLGHSYLLEDKPSDARKAFEKALKLRPDYTVARAGLARALLREDKRSDAKREAERVLNVDERNAEAHYVLGQMLYVADEGRAALALAEKALASNPDLSPAVLLKARTIRDIILHEYPSATKEQTQALAALSGEAVAQVDAYLKRRPTAPDASRLKDELPTLRPFAKGNFDDFVYLPKDVSQKAKFISKPQPLTHFLGSRQTVTLQMVLRRDGKVTNIRTVFSSDSDLTGPCISAARKIIFTPAMRDGNAVSQYIRVEYNFRR